MPSKQAYIHTTEEKLFFWKCLFFVSFLTCLNTFLTFHILDILQKIWNKQKTQIEYVKTATGWRDFTTPRNRQNSNQQGSLKTWMGNLKVWFNNLMRQLPSKSILKRGQHKAAANEREPWLSLQRGINFSCIQISSKRWSFLWG